MRGIGGKITTAAVVAIVALALPAGASAAKKPKLSISDATVMETDGPGANAIVTVTASKPPKRKSAKISYATSDGTATAPTHYTTTKGSLPFKRGVKTRVVVVPVMGNEADDGDRTFTVSLSKPKRAKIARKTATVTITDDDEDPFIYGIEAARAAPDGPVQALLDDVVVTHLKPAIGTEPAGFFVQDTQPGPALYIEADPATLVPALAEGDVVDFTINQMATRDQARVGSSITGLSRSATGQSVSALSQDVSSATDLVSAVDSYESEVVDLSATITGNFQSSGSGYVAAPIQTAGLPSNSNLRLRLPASLPDELDLSPGCSISLDDQPLVQYGAVAAPSAWSELDLDITSCPAPRLQSAQAISPNEVQLNFDREINPDSVLGDGSQFTIDGLAVSAAVASGRTISLTTSTQLDLVYTVEAAGSIEDTRGTSLDPDYDTVFFEGEPEGEPVDPITEARQAPDGNTSIDITDATVTYVKPAIGTDAAGFFVQAEPTGPGLFVATSPTLTPELAPGDVVSFTVITMGTTNGMRRATAILGLTRSATGTSLTPFTQNVSNKPDLVSSLPSYDSELIDLEGTIRQTLTAAGSGYVSARIQTAGVNSTDLHFRIPSAIQDTIDLGNGCTVDLNRTPLWMSGTRALATGWRASDFQADCPAPRVVSASSGGTNTALVSFDRKIDPATLAANGSQFSIGGLTVTGATMDGASRVSLQTTSQSPDQTYTVTVASSLKDKLGDGIDPTRNSASFGGPDAPSGLVINEIAPNIEDARDQIELRATSAGTTSGMQLWSDGAGPARAKLGELPDLEVQAGDLIVVHLLPTINVTTELSSKTECDDPVCHANAYDVRGSGQVSYNGERVISLYAGDTSAPILDSVPLYRTGLADVAAFPSEVQAIQAAGTWLPASCGGEACTYSTSPTVEAISVPWDGVGISPAGPTISRRPVADTNTANDWYTAAGPSSLGSVNP